MAEHTGPGSLKCAVGVSPRRPLGSALLDALHERVTGHNLRPLGAHAVLVFSDATVDEVRGWLRAALEPDESLVVLEFERWSAYGSAIDTNWLLRRGH